MKKIFVIMVAALAAVIFGCAKDPLLPSEDMAKLSFEKWIEKNAPNAVKLPTNDDVYIDYIYRNPTPWPDSLVPRLYSWFFIDYTGYTFDGRIFVSRRPDKIRKVGNWHFKTHFVDEFSQWYPEGGIWCRGLLDAFTQLHYMDSARIFVAAPMGYTKDTMLRNIGTAGETSSYIGVPVYFDVRFKYSLNYPAPWWRDSLIRFVAENWGQKPEDSIFSGCYMRKLVENPSGFKLDSDSTVYVHYKESFLDNHFIESNMDSVNRAENTLDPRGSYWPISKKVGSKDDGYMDFYNRVLPYMRKGETAEFAMLAGWGPFGQEGRSSGIPQIFPFENILITLYTYNDSVWADSTDFHK